jgi:hypothetical protein
MLNADCQDFEIKSVRACRITACPVSRQDHRRYEAEPDLLAGAERTGGVAEYKEATGALVTSRWQRQNRRVSDYPQEDQRGRKTGSTILSVLCISIFLPLTAYSRTDIQGSQHIRREEWLLFHKGYQPAEGRLSHVELKGETADP